MSIFAAYIEINDGHQFMAVGHSKEDLLGKLYREVHEFHQLDIQLYDIFIVEDEEIQDEIEKEVSDYFESCRMAHLLSLRSED